MALADFDVRVVTPDGEVFSGRTTSVVVPGGDGYFGKSRPGCRGWPGRAASADPTGTGRARAAARLRLSPPRPVVAAPKPAPPRLHAGDG